MLKVGIVGVGGMGKVHISNYKHISDCVLSAICDRSDEGKVLAEELGINYYIELEDMLISEQLDVLDICTPTFLHKAQSLMGISYGCNIICEKPLALKKSDAEEIYSAAEAKGKLLFVGQVLQFSPQAEVLHNLIKEKKYGKVVDANFTRLSAAPQWVKNGWLFDKNKSGLLPFDLHIHDLDLIVSLFGKPKSYKTQCNKREGSDFTEHYYFFYEFDKINIVAEAAWYYSSFPFTSGWRVYFENAVVVNDGKSVVAYPHGEEKYEFDTEEKILIPTGINLPPTGMFYKELTFFLDKIRETPNMEQYRKAEVLAVLEILESIE